MKLEFRQGNESNVRSARLIAWHVPSRAAGRQRPYARSLHGNRQRLDQGSASRRLSVSVHRERRRHAADQRAGDRRGSGDLSELTTGARDAAAGSQSVGTSLRLAREWPRGLPAVVDRRQLRARADSADGASCTIRTMPTCNSPSHSAGEPGWRASGGVRRVMSCPAAILTAAIRAARDWPLRMLPSFAASARGSRPTGSTSGFSSRRPFAPRLTCRNFSRRSSAADRQVAADLAAYLATITGNAPERRAFFGCNGSRAPPPNSAASFSNS